MINLILKNYKEYDIAYSPGQKLLFIHKPIPVIEFVLLRNMIKSYEIDIKEIVVRCNK